MTLTGKTRLTDAVFSSRRGGGGIKVDYDKPAYTWRDITGTVFPDQQGVNAPTLAAFQGGLIRRYAFSATDKADCEFHIPHDYVPGSDLFLHYHWSHNGTAISGDIVATMGFTYAKGHAQGIHGSEKTLALTYSTVNIATTPRYVHRIEEGQISAPGGSASLLDSDEIEVDGVVGVNFTMTTIPTITGGSPNEPFVFMVDLHYLSTSIGTLNKAPNFWR